MKYYRDKIINKGVFGFDSIQGCLENALNYDNGKYVIINFDSDDANNPNSILFNLKELEKEHYINLSLDETEKNGEKQLKLSHMSLTISGRNLLDELQNKSRWGKVKKRGADLVWIILTSIVTTLIVLKIQGQL